MQKSSRSIISALGIIAIVATIIGVLKVFFDDSPVFFFFSGITIGIIITIVVSEIISKLAANGSKINSAKVKSNARI